MRGVVENPRRRVRETPQHLGGRIVPRKVSLSMSGSRMAYGPPSASSSSRNCVSGGTSPDAVPHSGVIHHSFLRAAARNRVNSTWQCKMAHHFGLYHAQQ